MLDLKVGYYQIPVDPQDKDKTAFITPFRLYRFHRLPFGLRSAPATFQRLIDLLKTKIGGTILLAYLDDLTILSPTDEKHPSDLENIFKHLRDFHLRLNREKCRFACEEVKYLGHLISPRGIRTEPEKVDAITGRSPPTNLKQVHSFLQTCSCYKKFIPNIATISRLVSLLTKKDIQYVWGPIQEEAFRRLKEALTTTLILKQANPKDPYILRTDASGYALGLVLLQGEGLDERPIQYASRLLSSAERNYLTTEREALAILWTVQKFRSYLDNHRVSTTTMVDDPQVPTGRLTWWALHL